MGGGCEVDRGIFASAASHCGNKEVVHANLPRLIFIYWAPDWGRANGIAKSEKGSWCLRTGDWGFF